RYVSGQQYSITALTDLSGTIKERYAYDAYGNPSVFDGSGTARTATAEGNRYTYTGREWDEELALFHYRARMYDPSCGRFCSRDPIGYAKHSLGLFTYVGNRPTKLIDPLGNDWFLPRPTPPERWPYPSISYQDWLHWWNTYHGHGNVDTLSRGCIGVAGTVCGYTKIEEFRDALTNCWRSQPKAEDAAKKLKCNECDEKPTAIVAVQFSSWTWVRSNGQIQIGNTSNQLNGLKEPISVARIWTIVNNGLDGNGRPIPDGGNYDFQVQYGGCWFGANNGVTPQHPDMNVNTVIDLDELIKQGDLRGYKQHLWCAICRKCDEK
ncbi:MAG: RHS repeat-associated core domain-containing protein, partial [Planctomycetales bacterium]|nr:RHS repeat-associated core domain-containing protein [Planctomycetales bacterium]